MREFAARHLGPDDTQLHTMIEKIGVSSLDELINKTIPQGIRNRKELNLGEGSTEYDYLKHIREVAEMNSVFRSYIGMGYYNTITPSVILRNIFENPGWYTQYTPYQAEIAQGRLEGLLNFQTLVSDLTALPVANASLLDEATAAGEAMIMLYHSLAGDHTRNRFCILNSVFPQTKDVLANRAAPLGIDLVEGKDFLSDEKLFGVFIQYPDGNGAVTDWKETISQCHSRGVKVVMATDLLALTLLTPPGEMGADVAVGSAQRFGVPLGYGGPHAAFFSCKEEFKRLMPGRIIGVSIDAHGNRAYRMALQTREQHIRREKATSNICTAEALLANMAAMYAVYHGPQGLKNIASSIHQKTTALNNLVIEAGYRQLNEFYFDTLLIDAENFLPEIKKSALENKINFRYFDNNQIGISLDETTSDEDIKTIATLFAKARNKKIDFTKKQNKPSQLPSSLHRTSSYLTHPVFNRYHTETKMMRYIKRLEHRDLALNTSMIALGSCTMKLNAATEMIPVSWSEFSDMHPFVPVSQAKGYHFIMAELEKMLFDITGFSACSLQPNSGAQGEYTGQMVIRAYHEDHNEPHRNVALIPQSAHGTNPASAVLAGMKVIVVKTDDAGDIDVNDLRKNAEEHKNDLACLMVTYPSTHGVFEEKIKEICRIVHDCGGLVYMDGANMNAQVGLTSPAEIGADVCHLNLHKTFSIPHGGGGPGMGPICVNEKLAPYLPSHTVIKTGGAKGIHAVSAAPYGSASILIISYGYIKMLGSKGCTDATRYAILNANYLKEVLSAEYKILYVGENGFCAHEFIVDFREFKKFGIEVEDVAKRLMDYGFHAPTVSFPVHDTMMIEPTESEDKEELDRFAHALLSIKKEIMDVAEGVADKEDNLLKNAPHTSFEIAGETWNHPYNRMQAAYPAAYLTANKFWPAVSRINNTYGDRNLICVCPPIEEYEEVANS